MKTNITKDTFRVTTASYAGNDTANRAIAHGLGRVPKIALGSYEDGTAHYGIYGAQPTDLKRFGTAHTAVTAMDTTNIYVGNAASYINTANSAGNNFYWVFIG